MTGVWGQQLVRDSFWEEDQKIILALPLNVRPNQLACVKSAYKVCREDKLRRRKQGSAQSNSIGSEDPLWRKIWKLNFPSKMKHFIWRLAQNSHPLRSNLIRRGMLSKCRSAIGSMTMERPSFFKCKTDSARSVVEFILQAQEEKRATMIFILWAWWSERNNIYQPGKVAGRGWLQSSLTQAYIDDSNDTKMRRKMSKPPFGKLKLNCDASLIPRAAMGCWGLVIADSDGDVVSAGRGKVEHRLL
ncbi:hypothetical protein SORBI_3005G035600 [Sorghum bicolor]|uniref:Reverse transcriptase zinc-binding domain-containing protein n=1 Tax=Sorghum bicolor TaxID=4558 RepID=A0A1B6PPY5_SORBI|nr:hypothetical protein SORBI_3005G035600 [Sorghum bicolor]